MDRRRARRVPHRRPADGRGHVRAVEARAHGVRARTTSTTGGRRRRRRRSRGGGRAPMARDLQGRRARRGDPGRRARRRAGGADPAPAPAQGRQARRQDLGAAPTPNPAARRREHVLCPARRRGAGPGEVGSMPTSTPRSPRCARPATRAWCSPASVPGAVDPAWAVAGDVGCPVRVRHPPRERPRGAPCRRASGAAARRPPFADPQERARSRRPGDR